MQWYNGTGCHVFLTGTVVHMPTTVNHTDIDESVIIVNRNRHCDKNNTDAIESYRVILTKHDTLRIKKFGFPGMLVTVQGDLSTERSAEIIAEKIEFTHFPNTNQSQLIADKINLSEFNSAEKSYWYAYDGTLRQELTYIH